MAMQLRLVDPPPAATSPAPARASRATSSPRAARATGTPRTGKATAKAKGRKVKAAVGSARRPARGRRAASWGEWELDARTRRIGRAGIAAARQALEQAAAAEHLPRAS